MKKYLFSLLAVLVSTSSYANEIYFSKDRMESFACQVAGTIKGAYPEKTYRALKGELLDILRTEIDPWVDAYPIPAGFSLPAYVQKVVGFPGFPADRSEYYLQNAFILYGNPELELKAPFENYYASYIHLARSRHVAFLNGETKRFQMRSEENLLQQIIDHLPQVENFSFPYLGSDGLPIMQKKEGVSEKNLYKVAIGIPTHKQYDKFVYESQRVNLLVSPLFIWLLEQENFSVSPEELFNKSLEIYGNPMVALGVIPWIFSGDALTVDRGTSSVVSFKMERLVEGDDIPGLQYHFWGYIMQGIMGNKVRAGSLAYIYEKLYQKDIQDWTVDVLSLKTGDLMRAALKNPGRCR